MKKLLMLVVAGTFSISAAAYACDGAKMTKSQKTEKSQVAKKDTSGKTQKPATTKKS
jgi:hypothetical protein